MRLIDAEHLKRWIMLRWESGVSVGYDDVKTNEILEQIDRELTINPEPHWIPCSERLPDKPGSYICTCSDGTPYPKVTVIKFHPRTKAWVLNGTRAYWKVRAWMSLPEPWKGEGNDV